MTTSLIVDETTGSTIGRGVTRDQTRTISDLVEDVEYIGFLRNQARVLVNDSNYVHETTDQMHGHRINELLRSLTTQLTQEPLLSLLENLSDLGFSWRSVARLAGVSIPALRKWRRGESASGENRYRVARVVAFCELVGERYFIDNIAGWLETPIHSDAPVSGLDLLAEDRFDLALRLAGDQSTDPEQILDEVRPDWRERYSSEVEVFIASDGLPALRLGEGDS